MILNGDQRGDTPSSAAKKKHMTYCEQSRWPHEKRTHIRPMWLDCSRPGCGPERAGQPRWPPMFFEQKQYTIILALQLLLAIDNPDLLAGLASGHTA